MAANTLVQVPPVSSVASGDHFYFVPGVVPVARGNKDLILALGSVWSYITPCRLADYVTPLPDILNCKIEFFLTDLAQNTRIYFDNTSPYIAVTNTVDAQVQVFVPIDVQEARQLAAGNYFHLLRTTDAQGNVLIQTKGRVEIDNPPVASAPVADTDPYALSQTPFVPPTTQTGGTGGQTAGNTLVYTFDDPVTQWIVQHELGRYPVITTVDTTGARIFGQENYIDANNLTITFANPTTGVVYLN